MQSLEAVVEDCKALLAAQAAQIEAQAQRISDQEEMLGATRSQLSLVAQRQAVEEARAAKRKKAQDDKKLKKALKAMKLPGGWSSRPSQSRAGETRWENVELEIGLYEKPSLLDAHENLHVQTPILKKLALNYRDDHDKAMPVALLHDQFEKALGLQKGAVKSFKPLAAAFLATQMKAVAQLAAEQ